MKFFKLAVIILIFLFCNQALSAAIPAAQRQALIDLYNSTNGASWTGKTNWLGAVGTENTWFGVTTDAGNTTVQMISLPSNNLGGPLPSSLGNLSNLQSLDLYDNQLAGAIPAELSNLSNLQYLDLGANLITGSIPASFGNLSNLEYLYLDENQLSGTIPAELGNLSKLVYFYLGSNQLVGSIPAGFGKLSNLRYLDFSFNRLTGSIPTEFGNLSSLTNLDISANRLTGSIPSELGNLGNLTRLLLDSNQLIGSIPTSLTNLTKLGPTYTNIGYNSLYTSDAGLISFLNSKDSDWATTQTVAPTNVAAIPGASSAVVSWTPIPYSGDTGGYRVHVATVLGGPYTFYAQTADKGASSQLVSGLTPGTPYYFVVQTRTNAHANNQNIVDSEYSGEAAATPVIIPPSVTVTSPNGGESWIVRTTHNITWTMTAGVVNVKIEYSTNNGADWSTIIASTANTGTFPWTVPIVVSATCLIRVSEASTGNPTDMSNAMFAITAGVPTIGLSKTSFNFGTERYGTPTPAETVILTSGGTGILNWTATPSADWISVLPGTGTGSGVLTIGISRTDMAPGYYTGTITISDLNASNSPQTISLGLDVLPVGSDSPPFGNYATPLDGSTVSSSIPVTGWVLDDIGVQVVKIYRGTGLSDRVYIGDAVFSKGARPDVETAYPGFPQNDRAGWGYMLLTNFLPDGGNGTFQLLAYATDTGGHEVLLGSKTILCDNLHAVRPFGAIDTPTQGGTASGSSYINFGWALTPMPKSIPVDGSTITVWVDGLPLGHPTYNNFRSDIATLFPGYANSNGAVGFYYLNTTGFENRVHTIAWSVLDSDRVGDGIGSRYFTIQNVAGATGMTGTEENSAFSIPKQKSDIISAAEIARIPEDMRTPVYIKRGFSIDPQTETVFPEMNGAIHIQIPEVSRVAIYLNEKTAQQNEEIRDARGRRNLTKYEAYELVLGQLRPLPIGSTFDSVDGVFYWQPGAGFLGKYEIVFLRHEAGGGSSRKTVKIYIIPKG